MEVINLEDNESAVVFRRDDTIEAHLPYEDEHSLLNDQAMRAAACMVLFGGTEETNEILAVVWTVLEKQNQRDEEVPT